MCWGKYFTILKKYIYYVYSNILHIAQAIYNPFVRFHASAALVSIIKQQSNWPQNNKCQRQGWGRRTSLAEISNLKESPECQCENNYWWQWRHREEKHCVALVYGYLALWLTATIPMFYSPQSKRLRLSYMAAGTKKLKGGQQWRLNFIK